MTATLENSSRTLAFPTPPASMATGIKNGCGGWRDEERKWHRCTTTDDKLYAQGRCLRCYNRQRRVVKQEERGAAADAPLFPVVEPVQPVEDLRAAAVAIGGSVPQAAPEPEREQPPPTGLFALFDNPPAAPAETAVADDDYAWTLFDRPPHITVATEPRVTIAKDANCRINALAYALWGREVAAVEVLYDANRRALALRPCQPELVHARRLREDKGSKACSLRAFQTATRLVAEETIAITPRLMGDLLVLDLP